MDKMQKFSTRALQLIRQGDKNSKKYLAILSTLRSDAFVYGLRGGNNVDLVFNQCERHLLEKAISNIESLFYYFENYKSDDKKSQLDIVNLLSFLQDKKVGTDRFSTWELLREAIDVSIFWKHKTE